MGRYVNLKCPNCQFSFTDGYTRTAVSSNLGLPLVQCPKCKSHIKTGKNIWSLMSLTEKIEFVVSRAWQTVINGFVLTILSLFPLLYLFETRKNIGSVATLFVAVICGIALSSVITIWHSRKMIRQLEKAYKSGEQDTITV